MTLVRVSYNALSGDVMGQIGESGQARFIPHTDELLIYVRRDDPTRLMGFQLEDAKESLSRHAKWFNDHLGADFVGEVATLFDKAADVDLNEVADEDLEKVLPSTYVRLEVEVPQLDDRIELDAYRDWVR